MQKTPMLRTLILAAAFVIIAGISYLTPATPPAANAPSDTLCEICRVLE